MSLTVEDGTGVSDAESYASAATVVAYWAARPHSSFATTVAAASTANVEGAARESTAYMDATWGREYRGIRRGFVQGREFPRTGALDDAGYPLPDLPQCVVDAVCELTARALSDALADDLDRGGAVRRERFDTVEFEYFEGAKAGKDYGFVAGLLAPVLDDTGAMRWAWT